ncbi:hypothetical protein [Brevibacillus daliensis]|uniref:hypothetical protein n=1 Tax=Brevibacillus daliensis TaxID=2892995 RepID=UPI001E48B7C3|nr:hypothetical protein [Brevibacillus daliensis]
MALGTRVDGVNCIIVNSNLEEILLETNEKLDARMEINLTTEVMLLSAVSHIKKSVP